MTSTGDAIDIDAAVIAVRVAGVADASRIAPLFDAYRQFYGKAPDAALSARFIGERLARCESLILLADDGAGETIGFCQLYPSFCSLAAGRMYVLYDLFVTPTARRSGAARALIPAAVEHARREGYVRLELQTAHTNAAAQALYESLGWKRDTAFHTYSYTIDG